MVTIKFFGADWCPDCKRAKSFLNDNNISFEYIDVDLDQNATSTVEQINNGKRIIPTIVIDETPHTNPNNAELSSILGINENGRVVMFGADWCPDCRRAKTFMQNNGINFYLIDVDKHDWATDLVEEINNGKRIIPTLLVDDQAHTNPDNNKIKELLKLEEESDEFVYDSIIVGAGAAGLTTSIYAQRDRFNTLILDKKNVGGNAALTEKIENYPGFKEISGPALMDRMAEQARTYGAKISIGVEVEDIKKDGNLFEIATNMGTYKGRSVVISVGSTYRRLNIKNEDNLIGAGIHFCATCDGAFYRNKEVFVIGGGNSAVEEGIFLSGFCKKVIIVNRNESLSASPTYIEKLNSIDNIVVLNHTKPIEFLMNDRESFNGILVRNDSENRTYPIYADGAFIFIGLVPNTQSFKNIIELNDSGFIRTSGLAETSIQGIFAAGDCREGAIAQVAAATGEGVLASYGLRNYLKN